MSDNFDFTNSLGELQKSATFAMQQLMEAQKPIANMSFDHLYGAYRDALSSITSTLNLGTSHMFSATEAMSDTLAEYIENSVNLSNSLVTNFSSILSSLDIQDEYVELNEETLDTVSTLLNNASDQKSNDSLFISGRMPSLEFINLFITIFGIILTLTQNGYHQKQNALEAQKLQIQEQEYREQMLQIETEKLETLKNLEESFNDILEYTEAFQEYQLSNPETLESSVPSQEPDDTSVQDDALEK